MSLFVFLGPTLSVDEARRLCPAEYLPPVVMGDVYAVMERRPSTIAIIDGSFQNKPTVWHKEILYAMSRGVRVVGSSSMGALRAAELWSLGMEGVGAIFEAFRDGVYNDDDEVAVTHAAAEHGFRALSEAMVNIRAALAEAERRGLIGATTRVALAGGAKRLFYPGRSWPAVFQIGREQQLPAGEMAALEAFVRGERPNAKREDAVLLLRQLAASQGAGDAPPARPKPSYTFEPTWFWKKLLRTERQRHDALRPCGDPPEVVNHAALARHVRIFSPDTQDLLRSALLLHLIERQSVLDGLDTDDGPGAGEAVDPVARLDRLGAELASAHGAELDRHLSTELRRRGKLAAVIEELESRWRRLRAAGYVTDADLDAAEIDHEKLLSWLAQRLGRPAPLDLEQLAGELGIASVEQLTREAIAAFLAETAPATR